MNLLDVDYIWFGPSSILFDMVMTDYRLKQKQNLTEDFCSFLITQEKEPYLSVEYGFGFAKNSPLVAPFNVE